MKLVVDSEILRKVKENGGCLCKVTPVFDGNGLMKIKPVKCPCEEPFSLLEGSSCHCQLYSRLGETE